MAKFQFPQNPGTNRPNPFQDAAGKNPFGDPGSIVPDAAPSESSASPYQAQPHGDERPYQPRDYQPVLPHRAGVVLAFGVLGLGLEMIGAVVELIGAFATSELLMGIVWALPFQLVGLTLAIPAWIFGRNDLPAIMAGAMQPDGEWRTRVGFRLAIIGVLLGAVPVALYVGLLVFDAIQVLFE